jgi:hypothetical protein
MATAHVTVPDLWANKAKAAFVTEPDHKTVSVVMATTVAEQVFVQMAQVSATDPAEQGINFIL